MNTLRFFRRAFRRAGSACLLAGAILVPVASTATAQTINPVPAISTAAVGMPGAGSGLDVGVALGNDGTLAFRASASSSLGGVWARSGGALLTIQGNNFGPTQSMSVNQQGTLGYIKPGQAGTPDGLLSYSPSSGTSLTIRGSDFGLSELRGAALGNDDRFVFSASSALGTGLYSVNRSGGQTLTINGAAFSSRTLHGDIRADDSPPGSGYVAFRASDSTSTDGIFAASRSGGALLTIIGQGFTQLGQPSITGNTVTFAGTPTGAPSGIFSASVTGGSVITITGSNFAPGSIAGALAINHNGRIAYEELSASEHTIVIYGTDRFGNAASRLIGIGDPLAGSTVTRLVFSSQALNDSNDLAFYAELSNGAAGVFVASNVPGPAPAALLIGTAGLVAARRRRPATRRTL